MIASSEDSTMAASQAVGSSPDLSVAMADGLDCLRNENEAQNMGFAAPKNNNRSRCFGGDRG